MTDIQGNFVYLRTSMIIFFKGKLEDKLQYLEDDPS